MDDTAVKADRKHCQRGNVEHLKEDADSESQHLDWPAKDDDTDYDVSRHCCAHLLACVACIFVYGCRAYQTLH